MMKHWMIAVTASCLSWTTVQATNGELNIGDPAPKLAVKKFVKGDPVKSFEKGKIYAIEFWATW